MKKIIITYGTIAGSIIIGSMILSLNLADADESVTSLQWVGYLIMIIALSMIFVGVKRYRDQELGGVIRFGKAFTLGLAITLVASLIYVVAWEVNLSLTDYRFIDQYTEMVIAGKEAEGIRGAELDAVVAEMAIMKERYASPLFRLPMTFLEIFPVGLLISLISAAALRTKRMNAARALAD